MKKKTILYVMPQFGLAGAETMCENLINAVNKDKYNIIILSLYNYHSAITERLEKNKFKIIYLDKKSGLDLSMIKKIKKVIKEVQPDIIHTHRYVLEYVYPALLFKKFKKIKMIHTVHNIASKEVIKPLQLLQHHLFRKKLVTPVAISEIIQDSIVELYGLKKDEVPVIYNGINLKNCIVKDDYSKFKTILHIGRFENQKNHFELIDLFSKFIEENKLDDVKLKLIGDGPLFEDVKKYIIDKKMEKKILLLGNRTSCYNDLHDADLFVLPSKYEGMPMTIIEAMGTGLPIIANNVGGIPNMITSSFEGFLANSNLEFNNMLNEVYSNPKLRKKIGKNALKKSIFFDSETMAKKYEELYK